MRPRVHVYGICWNEEQFLPYFLRHYTSFADHVFLYDNESDDRSVEIARSFPRTSVTVFKTGGVLRDDLHIEIKSRAADLSRGKADWVITVDADELVWHADILSYLADCTSKGIAVLGTEGYNMISTSFPRTLGQVYEEVKTGAASPGYSKPVVYAPDRVRWMNFTCGAHHAFPDAVGIILREGSELKLLHYALLGLDYVLPRCAAKAKRLSAINLEKGWGEHYAWERERLTTIYNNIRAAATPLPFL